MTGLATRALAEEQMDAADLPEADYSALLNDLAKLNSWTMTARPTLAFLDRVTRRGDRLKLLDVGFGQGDVLRRIAGWARRRGIDAELVGIDLNSRSARIAAAATPPGLPIAYRTGDYADLAGEGWDVICSSQVAHHMSHDQLVAFIRFMEVETAKGWLISDLHRHRFAHAGFPLLARLMRWHRIVREDGTLSIARSFRPPEWAPILAEAGVTHSRVRRAFPFRLCVERIR